MNMLIHKTIVFLIRNWTNKSYTVTLSLLILFIIVNACKSNSDAHTTNTLVSSFENSLQPLIKIEGDSTWNIEERMNHYGVPGVSIAIIRDFKIDTLLTYGVLDLKTRELVTPSSLFRVGSVSKVVSAFGALKMVQENKLELDSPVNDKLKSWRIPSNKFTRKTPITLRHLLSHTAGFNHSGGGGYLNQPFPSLLEFLEGSPPANTEPIRVVEAPNVRHRYSGGGYSVMQQLMMDVEGKSYESLIKDLIFNPIGMKNSTFLQMPLPPDLDKRATTGHLENREAVPGKTYFSPTLAAGGLWTTPEDMAKITIEIQKALRDNSSKILSKKSADLMATPYLSHNLREDYGLGMSIEKGGAFLGHNGSAPGHTAHLYFHRDQGYGMIVVQNAMAVPLLGEIERSIADVYNWEGFLEPSHQRIMVDKKELERIEGRYEYGLDKLFKIFMEKDRLFIQYMGSSKIELIRIADNTYVRKDRTNNYHFNYNKNEGQFHCKLILKNGREFNYRRLKNKEKFPSEWVEENNFEKAFKAYQNLLLEQPENKKKIMDRIISWGNDLAYRHREFEKAIAVTLLSTKLFPDSSNTWENLAWTYAEAGDTMQAIKYYKKTLSLSPNSRFAKRELKMLLKLQHKN